MAIHSSWQKMIDKMDTQWKHEDAGALQQRMQVLYTECASGGKGGSYSCLTNYSRSHFGVWTTEQCNNGIRVANAALEVFVTTQTAGDWCIGGNPKIIYINITSEDQHKGGSYMEPADFVWQNNFC